MALRHECDLENRAMTWRIHEPQLSIGTLNRCEPLTPAAQRLNGYKAENGNPTHRKIFPESVLALTVLRSRSWGFWSIFQFIKKTYVWLVWIPLVLLGLGIAMNFLAVTMNHGIMPVVLPPAGIIDDNDKMHVAATANSRFLFLCDWIQLHATKRVVSPGDFLIIAGDFLKWPLVWMWAGFSWGQSTWRKLIGSYANT